MEDKLNDTDESLGFIVDTEALYLRHAFWCQSLIIGGGPRPCTCGADKKEKENGFSIFKDTGNTTYG